MHIYMQISNHLTRSNDEGEIIRYYGSMKKLTKKHTILVVLECTTVAEFRSLRVLTQL
jgi:hypothetical protein